MQAAAPFSGSVGPSVLWLLKLFQPWRIRRSLVEIRSRPASIVFDEPEDMPQKASAPPLACRSQNIMQMSRVTGALAGWELTLVAGFLGLKTLACRARDL